MIRYILLGDKKVRYELVYKNVKNINLRIKADKSIYVSASPRVSIAMIENFLIRNTNFILKALQRTPRTIPNVNITEEEASELYGIIRSIVILYYPHIEKYCKNMPVIKLCRMKGRWGSCLPAKCEIHFSTMLSGKPKELIEYVVLHEMTHFIHPNHSQAFYSELSKVCPDWTEKKIMLNSQ